jgi:hypothetical protein
LYSGHFGAMLFQFLISEACKIFVSGNASTHWNEFYYLLDQNAFTSKY